MTTSGDLSFYDSFLDKVRFAPLWPDSKEQASRPLAPRRSATLTRPPQVLVEPYTYLAAIPGKEVRSALIEAFNLWMHVPEDDIAVVKKVVGMLHTASLLFVARLPGCRSGGMTSFLETEWTTSRMTRS